MKDYINTIDKAERRYLPNQKVEVRALADGTESYIIRGYAALFNVPTELGYCQEIIAPGAFDDCLEDDVRCLFNHSSESVLGRTKAGTLEIGTDSMGLYYECQLDSLNTDHMNLYRSIQRGDINQSSFAFTISEVQWNFSEELDTRTIIKCECLYDVSPVTYPAYQDTTVSARGREDYDIMKHDIAEEKQLEINKREAFAMRWTNFKTTTIK
jgi:HK97 family phage prohead protease